jgi:hypothetical protein
MHLAPLEVIPSLGSTDSERFRQDWPEISQMDGTNFPVGGHGHRLVLKRIERQKKSGNKTSLRNLLVIASDKTGL